MSRTVPLTVLGFLFALALGGVVAGVLSGIGLGHTWAIAIGWLVFFGVGTALSRRAHSGGRTGGAHGGVR